VSGANCYSLRKRKCVEPATIALPAKPFDRSPWTRRAQSAFPRRAPQEFAAGCVSAVPDLRAVSGVHDIVGGIDSLRRIFGGCCWSDSAQCGVSSLPVVVLLELEELSLEIPCAPKRDVIQELSPQRADQPLDERVRSGARSTSIPAGSGATSSLRARWPIRRSARRPSLGPPSPRTGSPAGLRHCRGRGWASPTRPAATPRGRGKSSTGSMRWNASSMSTR
jgi:hypothetical protein